MENFDTMGEGKSMTLCISVVVCCNLLDLLFCIDSSGRGALLHLLVVPVVDIHLLLLDLALKSVLFRDSESLSGSASDGLSSFNKRQYFL
jgi:hypothetical protein